MFRFTSRHRREIRSLRGRVDELIADNAGLKERVEHLEPATTGFSPGRLLASKSVVVVLSTFCIALPTIFFSSFASHEFGAVPALGSIGVALYLILVAPTIRDMEGDPGSPLTGTAQKSVATVLAIGATLAMTSSGAPGGSWKALIIAVALSTIALSVAPIAYASEKRMGRSRSQPA